MLGHKKGLSKITMMVFVNPDCAPCEQVKSRLSEVSSRTSLDAPIVIVDTYLNPELAEKHKVTEQPCSIVFKDGKEKLRHIGAYMTINEIVTKINNVF